MCNLCHAAHAPASAHSTRVCFRCGYGLSGGFASNHSSLQPAPLPRPSSSDVRRKAGAGTAAAAGTGGSDTRRPAAAMPRTATAVNSMVGRQTYVSDAALWRIAKAPNCTSDPICRWRAVLVCLVPIAAPTAPCVRLCTPRTILRPFPWYSLSHSAPSYALCPVWWPRGTVTFHSPSLIESAWLGSAAIADPHPACPRPPPLLASRAVRPCREARNGSLRSGRVQRGRRRCPQPSRPSRPARRGSQEQEGLRSVWRSTRGRWTTSKVT